MADKSGKLKITPLGGVQEIGKNIYVFEAISGNKADIVVVDAGVYFPGHDSPGVDYTFPELNYLMKRQGEIRALAITNAKEAHCGGSHHLINRLGIKKVIGSKLALETVKLRLGEDAAAKIEWIAFESRIAIKLAELEITPLRITSSSAESYALHIKAYNSKVFYTSSYKIDQSPYDKKKTDLLGISELGSEAFENNNQVDLMMSDSANVETIGYSLSESELPNKFRALMESHPGRVIVNTYNSNTIRLQILFNVARLSSRKVALINKEARELVRAAVNACVLEFDEADLISIKDVDNYPDSEILAICTAPEGEALRELEKIAYDRSLELQIKEGDMVVNSADLPPGTVRIMAQISDQFFLKNVKILGGISAGVHVESHALTEEMKFLFNLVRPKYFIPVIGEMRHLVRHAKLAVDSGMDPGSIFILENGDQFEIENNNLRVTGHIEVGQILFNDSQDFHVDNKLIKERDALAKEGVVTVTFSINKKNQVVAGPIFSAKACTFSNNKEWRAFCLMNSQELVDAIEIHGVENPSANIDAFQDIARDHMNRIIKTQIGKKPAVIVLANQI